MLVSAGFFFAFSVRIMNRFELDKIMDTVDAKIAALGYECLEVEWDGAESTLRVFIDKDDAIIKMEDCLRVNDLLIEDVDLDALVKVDYRLEISSPGVERPLRKRKHFAKLYGQKVKVRLQERIENRVEGSGMLIGINADDVVSLELPTGVWNFPLQKIRKANLEYEWT